MLEVLKVIILGIVQGITEWLPISSTGHLILVEQLIQLKQSEAFTNMFNVVIQFGSIMAVVVIYFHKLNPFSPTKTEKQKKMTIQLWIKVVIGTIPALIGGVLLNDLIESKLSNAYVVALMLIVYGILFIIIEKMQHRAASLVVTPVTFGCCDSRCGDDESESASLGIAACILMFFTSLPMHLKP